MSEQPTFQRSPRFYYTVPTGKIEIPAPAPMPMGPNQSLWIAMLPAFGGFCMVVGLVVIMLVSKSHSSMFMLISIPIMITSFAASIATYFSQKKKQKKLGAKREARYAQVLDKYGKQVETAYSEHRQALNETHPNPLECVSRLEQHDRRLWERSPSDADFIELRLGVGDVPLAVEIKVTTQEVAIELDPLITMAEDLAERYRLVKSVPITMPLKRESIAGLAGQREIVLNTMRELVLELATSHSPDEVKIVAVFPEDEESHWSWMRWLPHCWTEDRTRRLLADNKATAHSLLAYLYDIIGRRQLQLSSFITESKEVPLPYYVIFLSDPELAENEPVLNLLLSHGSKVGASTVFLGDNLDGLPKGCNIVAQVQPGEGLLVKTAIQGSGVRFTPDSVDIILADKFARTMAPIRLRGLSKVADIPNRLSFLDLWGISTVEELDAWDRWSHNRPYETLAVPIGVKTGGKRLMFDLHEKAHGPHGLVAGATGSGKSELLQSIIGALGVSYHPHEVGFVLVDYKGGGMANAFLKLPHLTGVITNLEGNLTIRALIALRSELKARQQHFADAGVNHIDAYQKMYRDGKAKVPLPHLIIIIDEFAELASEQPDFMKELISAVRVGRSLGVHLILATQKPAGVVNEQIWGNSKFRLCLRVERSEDSREVIKKPDAANITLPGRAYFQVGNDEIFELFQSAYSGAPYTEAVGSGDDSKVLEVELDGTRTLRGQAQKKQQQEGITQIRAVEDYLYQVAENNNIKRLPGPWLPPLPEEIYLDDLMRDYEYGWNGQCWKEPPEWIKGIIGILDDPANQSQGLLAIQLGAEGHLQILGAPGCGKTTIIQTLITSLASLYSPENLNIYILDFGGRTLKLFESLPHVGGVAFDDDEEQVRALFGYLLRELERRKGLFSVTGVNTLPAYRNSSGDRLPAIVTILDNYSNFQATYADELEDSLAKLVQEGASAGIHFVITGTGPAQIRAKISSNMGLALALEFSDLGDYGLVVGRTGGLYPAHVPGRGLVRGNPPLEFHTALPARGDTEADRATNMKQFAESISSAWSGPVAPPIPMVPDTIDLGEVLCGIREKTDEHRKRTIACIGLDAEEVQPLMMDLDNGPHFLITGPPQCGKTTLLQTWLLSLCSQNLPEDLRLYLVDFSLAALGPLRQLPHVEAFVNSSDALDTALTNLTQELKDRKERLAKATEDSCADGKVPGKQGDPIIVVVIDEFYLFKESVSPETAAELERIIRRERGLDFHILVAATNSDISACWDGYAKAIMELQTGFLLGSTDHDDLHLFKLKFPSDKAGQSLPPGLGYFAKRGKARKVKIALPQSEDLSFSEWIKKIAAGERDTKLRIVG